MTALSDSNAQPPPNPPPLPPAKINLLQRITAPFSLGIRSHGSHSTQSSSASPREVSTGRVYKQLSSQTVAHRTGIPIQAIDTNREKTHAILAGQEILRTVRIHDGKAVEDFNLRTAINSYAPAYGPRSDAANYRREFLPAKDVRWSHGGRFDTIIATAALNGRISLYDVSRINSSRVELAWLHDHTGQVNKLDFDPTGGYLLLSGSQDKTVRIWDIREPKAVFTKSAMHIRHPVRDLKWSPTDVGEFALCTENGIIQRWDLRNPAQALLSINAHERACYTLDWHPDGKHLVSGGFDKYVKVWNVKSDNRKQKPSFQLKTPQAVMNLRWRPPCWTPEITENGYWQSTQIATSYADHDPRIHVWDFRRPHLPLRELDRYNNPPTDLMWVSEDLLWSVGNEGMFTQTDIRYVAQIQDGLAPCATGFMPDGSFITFAEDMRTGADVIFDDASAVLTAFNRERLSGATDDGVSRSLSDDDIDEEALVISSKRRRSKAASARSAKSQGNTPPSADVFPPILSLDLAVINRSDAFDHDQAGTLSSIEGIAAEPDVVKFLAENYARPSSNEERKSDPNAILRRLEDSFLQNARVCDYVSLHRTAQSWRMLCTIVITELTDWAEQNRSNRLRKESRDKAGEASSRSPNVERSPPPAKSSVRDTDSRLSTRPQKVVNHLFKGVVASEMLVSEAESTSNMTTPLAMPLPDSPHSRQGEQHFSSLHEIVEPITPLPPSVVNSHSAAAAASQALLGEDDSELDSPMTSPAKPRRKVSHRHHKRNATDLSVKSSDHTQQSRSPLFLPTAKGGPNPSARASSPVVPWTQEDRRAAIRDYRAQARPLFTLEEPVRASNPDTVLHRHSTESFPMFSLSTESSGKDRSLLESFDSLNRPTKSHHDSEQWHHVDSQESLGPTPPSGESGQTHQSGRDYERDAENRRDSIDFAIDDALGFSFGADGQAATKPPLKQKGSSSANLWEMDDFGGSEKRSEPITVASSASETMFHFEQVQSAPQHRIYTSNPIKRMASKAEASTLQSLRAQDLVVTDDDLDFAGFVYSDFRPMDFTSYEPRLPWAWSALPLICHTIAFDLQEGIACGQFAVHLLMHLHPFFFNQAFRGPLASPVPPPTIMAERLMRPDLSHRIIEGLFVDHVIYLKKAELFGAMVELKKLCVEFDYPAVYRSDVPDQPIGSALKQDVLQLQMSCSRCHAFTPRGTSSCQNCRSLRDVCPVCQTHHSCDDSKLWTYCQVCGHGGHVLCMQEWFLQPGSEGECPTMACGCDCGPGSRRWQRIAQQVSDAANNDMIRGARSGPGVTKRDPVRAYHSPAVDKARDTLRYADLRETQVPSGDENSRHSVHSRGGSRGGGGFGRNGSRAGKESVSQRRVRLITPSEQSSVSQSGS